MIFTNCNSISFQGNKLARSSDTTHKKKSGTAKEPQKINAGRHVEPHTSFCLSNDKVDITHLSVEQNISLPENS